jgi:hypothetical protein
MALSKKSKTSKTASNGPSLYLVLFLIAVFGSQPGKIMRKDPHRRLPAMRHPQDTLRYAATNLGRDSSCDGLQGRELNDYWAQLPEE